ncbi:MAG: hypothetical protein H7Y32_12145 [Chloroflexales bacterium]|nr:hypothetical protein [Chloroflexales bacterium]
MATPQMAEVDMTLRGHVGNGKEFYHQMVFVDDVKYSIELVATDQEADLDLYITDEDGNILYEDESAEANAAVWFKPAEHAIYNLYVKSASGSSTYMLTITE